MVDADDVRHVALALPYVAEIESDGFDFRVADKGFVWSGLEIAKRAQGKFAAEDRLVELHRLLGRIAKTKVWIEFDAHRRLLKLFGRRSLSARSS